MSFLYFGLDSGELFFSRFGCTLTLIYWHSFEAHTSYSWLHLQFSPTIAVYDYHYFRYENLLNKCVAQLLALYFPVVPYNLSNHGGWPNKCDDYHAFIFTNLRNWCKQYGSVKKINKGTINVYWLWLFGTEICSNLRGVSN